MLFFLILISFITKPEICSDLCMARDTMYVLYMKAVFNVGLTQYNVM